MKKVLVAIALSAMLFLCRTATGQSLDDQLIKAVETGNAVTVQQLLQQGANIDVIEGQYGSTALIQAVFYQHTDLVKLLVEKGANIEAKNKSGGTALIIAAAAYGRVNIEVVKLLLDHGANVEDKDTDGNTALMYAVMRDHTDLVRLLLNKGANAETRNSEGLTTLNQALTWNNTEIVRLLLENGANLEAKDSSGFTVLDRAQSHGSADVVKLLQQAVYQDPKEEKALIAALAMNPPPDVPAEAKRHMSRGIAAVESAKTSDDFKVACNEFRQVIALAPWLPNGYRNLAIAQDKAGLYGNSLASLRLYLMTKPSAADADWAEDLKSKVEFRMEKVDLGEKLRNALHSTHVNMQDVQKLIANGADLNEKDETGNTPLALAVGSDLTQIVREMLDKGAEVNAKGNYGRTALMTAVLGNTEMVQLLIQRGATVNASDQDGETVLMRCSCGDTLIKSRYASEISQILINAGADVNARDNNGKNALNYVEGYRCHAPDIAQILRAAGAR